MIYSYVLIEKVIIEHMVLVLRAHASMCVTHKRKLGPLDKKMTALLVLEGIELYMMSDFPRALYCEVLVLPFSLSELDACIKIRISHKLEFKFEMKKEV